MKLKYYVPFKAQIGQDAQLAVKESLINIEGTAIDTTVNTNKWQVPPEDLDFFVSSLQGAQLRIDHAESALAVIGKVPEAKNLGSSAWFRAEIGDASIIQKVLRGYLTHVSVQVDSDNVECSKCKKQTRNEGMLVHLCPGAWEVVHKPKVRELSIVASPAYKTTEFKPVGFAAAMNESQSNIRMCEGACVSGACTDKSSVTCRIKAWSPDLESFRANVDSKEKGVLEARKQVLKRLLALRVRISSQLLDGNEDVGSNREVQEPENKTNEHKEVKPLSAQQNGQQAASPHQAQGVVNVAPGEGAPKQVTYEEMQNQLKSLGDQLMKAEGAEIDALGKKIAEIEAEVGRRATKNALTRKLSELSKKMSESAESAETGKSAEAAKKGKKADPGADAVEDGDDDEDEEKKPQQAGARAHGKGLISTEDMDQESTGPSSPWFKDFLKANAKMREQGNTTFSGQAKGEGL